MSFNRKVLEQAELADRLHAEAYGKTDSAPNAPADTQAQDQTPPEDQQVNQQQDPAPPKLPPASEETWEQRYNVLQGKYTAEVPRMADTIRAQKQQIDELATVVNQLKEQLAAAPKQPDTAPVDLKSMTPEQVVEQFGEDFAAAVGSIAANIATQQTAKVREELAPKVESAAKDSAKRARVEFMTGLEKLVPNWREIDVNPGFTDFLDGIDPMTGRQRRVFFNEADASNDAARVAQFFTSFAGNSAAPTPPTGDSRMALENSVAPRSGGRDEAPAGKRIWAQADIRKFYRDQQRGLYSSAEAQRIESDIFAAAQEGRMTA